MKEGWEIKKIKDICDKASSNIVQNKITDVDGDYPVYGASGYVQNVNFFHREKPYIGIVKDGAGVGRVNMYPAYSSLLGTLQYILPKNGYLLEYVAYALKSLNLASFASGATIPHIYFKNYGESEIPVAPIAEQEKIVAELDCLSGIIEKKKQQLKEYDALAQSIFYEMFGNPEDNEGGWQVKLWREVFDTQTGKLNANAMVENGEYPFFTCSKEIYHIDCYAFDCEALLLAGNNATANYDVKYYNGKFNAYQRTYVLTLKDDSLYHFFKFALENKLSLLQKQSIGGMTKYLTMGILEKISFIVPPLALQQEFASKIEAIEKQKELIKKSIEDVETLFNSRMDYYFN